MTTTPEPVPSPEPAAVPQPLWTPGPERIDRAQVTRFHDRVARDHGAPPRDTADPLAAYTALHAWSVREPEAFWRALTEWFDVRFGAPYSQVLADPAMPGARWFPGATVNYAEHALR
ncbi:MAG: acetoacetate--CoA ligase, partial [Actinomycetia bacterium]|nr:acetoacetate--CoA ligase [Actinomycetes bacterium]